MILKRIDANGNEAGCGTESPHSLRRRPRGSRKYARVAFARKRGPPQETPARSLWAITMGAIYSQWAPHRGATARSVLNRSKARCEALSSEAATSPSTGAILSKR
jgi:hypothetical protein